MAHIIRFIGVALIAIAGLGACSKPTFALVIERFEKGEVVEAGVVERGMDRASCEIVRGQQRMHYGGFELPLRYSCQPDRQVASLPDAK